MQASLMPCHIATIVSCKMMRANDRGLVLLGEMLRASCARCVYAAHNRQLVAHLSVA